MIAVCARAASDCRGFCTPGPHLWGQKTPLTLRDPGPEPYQPCGQKELQEAGIKAGKTPNLLSLSSPKPNLQSSLMKVFVLNQGLT